MVIVRSSAVRRTARGTHSGFAAAALGGILHGRLVGAIRNIAVTATTYNIGIEGVVTTTLPGSHTTCRIRSPPLPEGNDGAPNTGFP